MGLEWSIFGRIREARAEVPEADEEVCSVRIVVLCAMHAYRSGVDEEEDAIVELLWCLLEIAEDLGQKMLLVKSDVMYASYKRA